MKKQRCDRGFTLIELIFFMVIVSLSLTGIAPLANQVVSKLYLAREYAQAHFLAQAVLEKMKAEFAGGKRFETIIEDGCDRLDGTSWVQGFSWNCQIETAVEGSTTAVAVTISWLDTGEIISRETKLFVVN